MGDAFRVAYGGLNKATRIFNGVLYYSVLIGQTLHQNVEWVVAEKVVVAVCPFNGELCILIVLRSEFDGLINGIMS